MKPILTYGDFLELTDSNLSPIYIHVRYANVGTDDYLMLDRAEYIRTIKQSNNPTFRFPCQVIVEQDAIYIESEE